MYPNRTLCDVLAEMRKAHKAHNYSYLEGLIEEAQSMGNKMEASLGDKSDVERFTRDRSELKREIKALKLEKDKLEDEIVELEARKEQF